MVTDFLCSVSSWGDEADPEAGIMGSRSGRRWTEASKATPSVDPDHVSSSRWRMRGEEIKGDGARGNLGTRSERLSKWVGELIDLSQIGTCYG